MVDPKRTKIRLGDLLIQQDLISEEQLNTALASQKTSGKKLGRALIDLGFVEEDAMLELLSQQLNVPFIKLRNFQFDQTITERLPDLCPTFQGYRPEGRRRKVTGRDG